MATFKLALGAGHCFNTPGKRCLKSLDPNETREWWLNDRIADKVEELLSGYNGVEILRLDDSDDGADDIALATRVKRANEWGADFYLSIHHNAGVKGGKGGGIVAYCHPKAGGETVVWRDELYKALAEHTGLRGNRSTPKATADHYVTRNTKMPAVLLELGFMDSATDVPVILSEDYAAGCATAIVEVIIRKADLSRKETDTTNIPDEWAAQAWYNAMSWGVLDGSRPRDPMTRQEFAVVMSKLGLLGKN